MRFFSTLAASTLGTLVALSLIVLVGFLFFTALVTTVATTGTSSTRNVRPGSVLEVRLSGSVPELASRDPLDQVLALNPPIDLVGIKSGLKKAADDDRIEAVWLRTQGLAASWSTLQEIRQALHTFKKSGKPLIASSGESFISERDYFLSSVADKVYAAPGSFFAFNGLVAQAFYYKGLFDKLGIEPTVVRGRRIQVCSRTLYAYRHVRRESYAAAGPVTHPQQRADPGYCHQPRYQRGLCDRSHAR